MIFYYLMSGTAVIGFLATSFIIVRLLRKEEMRILRALLLIATGFLLSASSYLFHLVNMGPSMHISYLGLVCCIGGTIALYLGCIQHGKALKINAQKIEYEKKKLLLHFSDSEKSKR